MSYDVKVPESLKREQQWFGSIIGRPIDENSCMNPISPSGRSMEEEAAEHIQPSPTLRPAQRIQIYNQQYWWRLLNTLQESFPLLSRLFGFYDFNRSIAVPYLEKYPPRHWSLSFLGDRLLQWCQEDYHAKDKKLVLQAAELDYAFSDCFIVGEVAPITMEDIATEKAALAILEKVIYLQRFVCLFEYEYDFFKYRIDFLEKNHDHWLENDFPPMDNSRPFYYALYRTKKNDISWKEITRGEFLILSLFQKGASVDDICEMLENQPDLYPEAAEKMQLWFHEWAQRGWLSLKNPKMVLENN
jgi:hypothetical protein